ncbi:putative nucleocapsid protein [Chrysanthemum mosaic-associated virus]|uniref:Nucleocapsid protein n=1 Tax=Chrysanthemum mosaic-associated virus TaxID=2746510 RepID=A0AAU9B5R0_9VIRU|nr:putative nucleocapsid protein [Chrysanthemum mosaic-associated virus]BCK60943.1 putative nucleocapsid protein [Chrysanthemum mosaic-associated virus]
MADNLTYVLVGDSQSKSISKSLVTDAKDTKFKPGVLQTDTYDLFAHVKAGVIAVDCADICSSTKEIRDLVKLKGVTKRTLASTSGPLTYFLVYNLKSSSDKFTMSANRFFAICSATLTMGIVGRHYDWITKTYKEVQKAPKISDSYINRLAAKVGISKDSVLYWLYLPGSENCFDMFPEEIIAISAWRVLNVSKSRIGKEDPVENLRSLANKLHKRGCSVEDFSTQNLVKYFTELNNCVHTNASVVHATKLHDELKQLFHNFM